MRMTMMAACLGCLSVATVARADIVDKSVVGASQPGAADARVSALDDAFATALRAAVDDALDAKIRSANKATIDRELVEHARRFVASFKVTADDSATPRHLTVLVHIDRDKLNARLLELGLAQPTAAKAAAAPAAESKFAVLMRATTPAGLFATYRTAAVTDVPGGAMVTAALRHAGVRLVNAPASGPAAHAGGELPLDDDSARALAGDAKADTAVIVGASVDAATSVRGTLAHAATGRAHVRIIDARDGAVQADVASTAGAYAAGDDKSIAALALDRAVGDAIAMATAAPLVSAKFSGLSQPSPRGPRAELSPSLVSDGHVLIRFSAREVGGGGPTWQSTQVVRDAIAARPKSPTMTIRRLDAGEIVFDVATGESAAALAKVLSASPGVFRARAHDGIVDVEIQELAQ